MAMCRIGWSGLILPILFLWASISQAGLITVDFNSTMGGVTEDYNENGFTFSPNCHYDITHGFNTGYEGTPYIGIDRSGCRGGGLFNSAFGGPSEFQLQDDTDPDSVTAVLYITFNGNPFSLLDFWSTSGVWNMESSNDGFFSSPSNLPQVVEFSGNEWTNVNWLLFKAIDDPGEPVIGMDHIRFKVPEPTVMMLMLIGILALVWNLRIYPLNSASFLESSVIKNCIRAFIRTV